MSTPLEAVPLVVVAAFFIVACVASLAMRIQPAATPRIVEAVTDFFIPVAVEDV